MRIRTPFFLLTLPAALAVLAAPPLLSQAAAQTAAKAPPVANATPAATASDGYRSAFEGYQPYTDEKTVNWKEANDTTARIGGWRAYAKEAAATEPNASASTPTESAPSAKP